jgi:hypothetical protein
LLHHKSLLLQAGGDLPVNIHYGLQHFAQWGGKSPNELVGKLPTNLDAYQSIFLAKEGAYFDSTVYNEGRGRYGNHIGSRIMGMDINLKKFSIGWYWQTIFEDLSGKGWRNIEDGLWGVYWQNTNTKAIITNVVAEFVNTTDQSGFMHDYFDEDSNRVVISGNDNYFHNSVYRSGWTYQNRVIGTPFIQPFSETDENYFLMNNKTRSIFVGIDGNMNEKLSFSAIFSHNINYGRNLFNRFTREHWNSFDPAKRNTSFLLQVKYKKYRHSLNLSASGQWGSLFRDSAGVLFSYTYRIR